jgi:PIN domain
VDERLTKAIEAEEPLATLGLVVLEVLAGARDEQQAVICDGSSIGVASSRSRSLPTGSWPPRFTAPASRARTAVRRLPDCLIAVLAMRVGAELLHQDADFYAIAQHAPLAVVEP